MSPSKKALPLSSEWRLTAAQSIKALFTSIYLLQLCCRTLHTLLPDYFYFLPVSLQPIWIYFALLACHTFTLTILFFLWPSPLKSAFIFMSFSFKSLRVVFFFYRSSPVSLTFSPPLHPSPSVGTSPSSLHLFLSRALSPFCNPTFFSHRSLWIFHDLVAQRWGEKTSSIWHFHRTNIYSQDCV